MAGSPRDVIYERERLAEEVNVVGPASGPGGGWDDSHWGSGSGTKMPHAIIRGRNGRRHEVDFGDAPIRVEVYASEETVEIFVEADFETHAEERRRFAILNIPRHLFSEATGEAARRATRIMR